MNGPPLDPPDGSRRAAAARRLAGRPPRDRPAIEDWMACAVCARLLERHRTPAGEVEWIHPTDMRLADAGEDHPAVPAPRSQVAVELRCDFCHLGVPRFMLPVADFAHAVIPDQNSVGGWACCPECAELLERDNWSGLLRRSWEFYLARHEHAPEEARTAMARMFRQVRRNVTGVVRPL